MAGSTDQLTAPYRRRLEHLKLDRDTWRDHWKDLAEYIIPRFVKF